MIKTATLLLKYFKNHIFALIISIISFIAFAIFSCLIPLYVGETIDNLLSESFVLHNLILLIIFTICACIFSYIGRILINRLSFLITRDIRNDTYNKIVHLPLSYIDSHAHGDIVNRVISDASNLSNSLILIFTQVFSGITIIIFSLVFMIRTIPLLGIIIALLTPLSIFISLIISKKTYKYHKKTSIIQGEETSYINEMISRQKVVSSFGYNDISENKFHKINDRFNSSSILAIFFSSTVNPITRLLNNIIYAIAALICALTIINGNSIITVGIMVTFLAYASEFGKPFNELTEVISEIQSAKVSTERLNEILSLEIEKEIQDGLDISNINNIEFKNVDFSYVKGVQVINDFSTSVDKGKKIAIVGTTGCGKTTIINLLMRFYDIDSGTIYANNIDYEKITKKSIRQNVSMVLQETWLMSGTIYDNILIGKMNGTKEEAEKAAVLSKADSFIRKLPHGYNTFVSNDTGLLSEGERQLICIARAMIADSSLLILDEATSSIDSRTEIQIGEAFDNLTKGKTSIIIAHRLSTIKNADIILVMDKGRIIEYGNHESLLKSNGFYSNIYNSQFNNM